MLLLSTLTMHLLHIQSNTSVQVSFCSLKAYLWMSTALSLLPYQTTHNPHPCLCNKIYFIHQEEQITLSIFRNISIFQSNYAKKMD